MTKVSIFTPVHKVHKFFDKCIDSVCKQSYTDWEWIILDNSDNTNTDISEYVFDYIKTHYGELSYEWFKKRIFVYKSIIVENKNIGFLKNVCSRMCTGDILVELDYDDCLDKFALEYTVQGFESEEGFDFMYSDWINLQHFEDKEPVSRTGYFVLDKFIIENEGKNLVVNVFGLQELNYDLLSMKAVPLHIRCWRKQFFNLINGFDENLEIMDDFDIILKSLIYGKCGRISYPCCIVNYHGENTTDKYTFEETHILSDKVWKKWENKIKTKFDNMYKNNEIIIKRFIPNL